MEKYIITGKIPEKQYTLIRHDGLIEQNQESIDWEQKIKIEFQDHKGWVSYNDMYHGAYTPLQAILTIHTHDRPTLIKQIKATLDAFSDIAYVNDCSIIDLTAEIIDDDTDYAELLLRPAEKQNITLPTSECINLDRYIGPVKNSTFDSAGYPLQTDEYKKDKELRDYIRQEFASQKMTDEDIELTMHFQTVDVGVEMELEEKLEKINWDRYPVRRPDLDNCAYQVLAALNGILFSSPEKVRKLHLLKTYYNPEISRNRIWVKSLN